jgi:hypothetical protein
MKRLAHSLRSQSIGVLALFVALGGTGYAAINLPRNSVGARQLRNGAVTANKIAKGSVTTTKLDSKSIAGSVVFWAKVDENGQVLASSAPATTSQWASGLGNITFTRQTPASCFPLAQTTGPAPAGGYVTNTTSAPSAGGTTLVISMVTGGGQPGPDAVDVAEICP